MSKDNWKAGNWQGYLSQSKTRKERDRRLEDVPDHYLNQVKSHLVTLYKIKEGKKS